MANIYINNWNIETVLLAKKMNLGIEIRDFTEAESLEAPQGVIDKLGTELEGINRRGMHGPFWDMIPASRDSAIREAVMRRYNQAYDACGKAGATHLVLHSGYFPKTYSKNEWVANSVAFWKEFIAGKPEGINVHIENVYENNYELLNELIDTVNHPYLSICMDIGHANANSSVQAKDWIKGLNGHIGHAHIHNNGGEYDDHAGPSEGTIPMRRTLDALLEYVPEAAWTMEVLPKYVQASIEWLIRHNYLQN